MSYDEKIYYTMNNDGEYIECDTRSIIINSTEYQYLSNRLKAMNNNIDNNLRLATSRRHSLNYIESEISEFLSINDTPYSEESAVDLVKKLLASLNSKEDNHE